MFKLFSIVFVAFFVQGALSQEILDGQCPEVTPIENFDYEGFTGHYFGLERFPDFTPVLNNTRCTVGEWSLVGNKIKFVGNGIDATSGLLVSQTFDGVALSGGAFILNFVQNANTANAWVIATDYTNYVSAFACVNITPSQFARSAWVLVRDLNVSEELINEARSAFKSVNINSDSLLPYDNSNCEAN